jgi:hypothetical protein
MPIQFKTPLLDAKYTLRDLDELKGIPIQEHENVRMLQAIIPKTDVLKYYSVPLPDVNGDVDWYEDGVAIVRDNQIVVLAKLDEYHDCGVF